MPELNEMFKRQIKYIFTLLGIYALGLAFTEYDPIFAGLILGTIFSLYNFWTLVIRNKKFAKAIEEGRKVRSLGSMTRFAVAALAAIIALQYPEQFNIVSVIIGLMTSYIVIMIDYFLQHLRRF